MAEQNGARMTDRRASRNSLDGRWPAAMAAVVLAATLFGCGQAQTDQGQMEEEAIGESGSRQLSKPAFNARGELERPEGYREWIFVGTPLTPNELNPPEAPFPEFHNVYIHPDDYAQWQQTGGFQDGTILIKELVSVGSKEATSGKGYFMGEFIGLEAAVKDSRRFADEPGHWAYFSFGHAYPLAATTAVQPVASCNSCHAASAADDWVFTQYYPVLSAARGSSDAR